MGIEKQFMALQKGFHELITPNLLKLFDERELELIVSGLGSVDVDDWMCNTRLKHCSPDTDVIKWFWKVCVCVIEVWRVCPGVCISIMCTCDWHCC